MKVKALIVVMSHLSDVQEMIGFLTTTTFGSQTALNKQINFAKFVILQCNGDLNQEIDADEMWNKFINK